MFCVAQSSAFVPLPVPLTSPAFFFTVVNIVGKNGRRSQTLFLPPRAESSPLSVFQSQENQMKIITKIQIRFPDDTKPNAVFSSTDPEITIVRIVLPATTAAGSLLLPRTVSAGRPLKLNDQQPF